MHKEAGSRRIYCAQISHDFSTSPLRNDNATITRYFMGNGGAARTRRIKFAAGSQHTSEYHDVPRYDLLRILRTKFKVVPPRFSLTCNICKIRMVNYASIHAGTRSWLHACICHTLRFPYKFHGMSCEYWQRMLHDNTEHFKLQTLSWILFCNIQGWGSYFWKGTQLQLQLLLVTSVTVTTIKI